MDFFMESVEAAENKAMALEEKVAEIKRELCEAEALASEAKHEFQEQKEWQMLFCVIPFSR